MPVSFDTSISTSTTKSQISFRPSPYIINSHLYSSNRKISLSIQAVAYTLLTPIYLAINLNLYGIDCPQISPAFRKFSNILLSVILRTGRILLPIACVILAFLQVIANVVVWNYRIDSIRSHEQVYGLFCTAASIAHATRIVCLSCK